MIFLPEEMPYLDSDQRFSFPDPDTAAPEGVLAVGGKLSPGMLLSAYEQGVFPWYDSELPVMWWNPPQRFVLPAGHLHIAKRLRRTIKKGDFTIQADTHFSEVIHACSTVERPGQEGTWITPEMEKAYNELHELGYAHSIETWMNGRLAGGLYGISLGSMFFGESMFSYASGASKIALFVLHEIIKGLNFSLIDCQVYTDLLASFGAFEIPRRDFMTSLQRALSRETIRGSWEDLVPFSP